MNKKLLFICLIGLISISTAYAKCDGGTEVTGNSGSFCKSNEKMNWWSAAACCQANGKRLANIYEMCPNWDGVYMGTCLELNGVGNGYAWTSTAYEEYAAFLVELSNGFIAKDDRDSSSYGYAFCK